MNNPSDSAGAPDTRATLDVSPASGSCGARISEATAASSTTSSATADTDAASESVSASAPSVTSASASSSAAAHVAAAPAAGSPRPPRGVAERLRKPLSRVAAAAVVAVAFLWHPVPRFGLPWSECVFEAVGFSLLMLAALGRIWCAIYISGRKDRELCADGPYSLCRNPLYFFSFVGVAGFFLAIQNFAVLAFALALYLLYYRFVIRGEERRLAALFGESYARYQREVPRFFPVLRRPTQIETSVVHPGIIERALREVVWFLLTIILIEVAVVAEPRIRALF